MNEARSQILDGIRRALHRGELSGDALKAVEARLARPPRGPAVARAVLAQPEKVALFCQWAEANNATVARVAPSEVAAEVAAFLARNNLPAEAAIAPSPQLAGYDWAGQKMLSLRRGRGEGSDHVSITGAFAAIAETGTVVMASGPEHPVTLNLLPDTHIVVLRAGQVVASYEDGWDLVRAGASGAPEGWPRTVNLITGPSRTGDIEQRIQLGAHGPRRLHIVLVDGEPVDGKGA